MKIPIKLIIVPLLLPVLSCTKDSDNNHRINHFENRIVSEMFERDKTSFTANYDKEGNYQSFQVMDSNLKIIVNIHNNKIISYSIEDDYYYKLTNLMDNSNIANSMEKIPLGEIEVRNINNKINIKSSSVEINLRDSW